jgi:uncharacterized protein YndB with AHSA1/START domain
MKAIEQDALATDESLDATAIRAGIRIAATPEQAWAAWADPEKLAQWFVDEARGSARVGETMTWVWREFGMEAPYLVLESVPGRRLVLATPAGAAPPGRVEITLAAEGGETRVLIVNSGFLDPAVGDAAFPPEVIRGIRSGWTMTLALLKEYLERHYGRPKRSFLEMRRARFSFDGIPAWFTEEAALVRWLTVSGAPAAVGGRFTLALRDGPVLECRTIARTDLELAFAVPSEEVVIELKSFAAPPHRYVAVRGTSWHAAAERLDAARHAFSAALDRLVAELELCDGAAAGEV